MDTFLKYYCETTPLLLPFDLNYHPFFFATPVNFFLSPIAVNPQKMLDFSIYPNRLWSHMS